VRPGWRGRLELTLAEACGVTHLRRSRHEGPLRVQRTFAQRDGSCHIYVLHPPGGIVGGDRLSIDIEVEPGARTLVTTPGATKLYRTLAMPAEQDVTLRVHAGAQLEWFPQETIAFARANHRLHTRIELEDGARLCAWDVLCLGRPAAGEGFRDGSVVSRMVVERAGRPIWLERADYRGDRFASAAGLRGFGVVGSLMFHPAKAEWLDALQSLTEREDAHGILGATWVRDVFVCRYLGHHADYGRAWLATVWLALREIAGWGPGIRPRIWAT